MNWVMLRGLGRHSDHWGDFPQKMEQEFGKVMLINLPGIAGETNNVPISIGQITDHIRKEYLSKKGEDDWGILAISLGGMIALDWVNRYPQDFKHIVTMNSSTNSLSKFYERMQPQAIKVILKSIFEKDVRMREKGVLELTCNLMPITDAKLDRAVEIANAMTINRPIFLKQLYAASKFKCPDGLEIPYTVLAAQKDRLASVSCSKALAKHFSAPIKIHPTAGHDLPADAPEWIIEQLKNL